MKKTDKELREAAKAFWIEGGYMIGCAASKSMEDSVIELMADFHKQQQQNECEHDWSDYGIGQVDCCNKCKDWRWGKDEPENEF